MSDEKLTNFNKNVKKIYGLHDTQLHEYVAVTSLRDVEVDSYFVDLANDIRSPYYQRSKDFDCYCLGSIDDETGVINIDDRHILCNLSKYIDLKRVEYQRIVQVLNYLPVGYFKMPKEMQDGVQQQISDAVKDYVNKYADIDKLSLKINDDVHVDVSSIVKEQDNNV